jgi:excisionase family DNA binding protein
VRPPAADARRIADPSGTAAYLKITVRHLRNLQAKAALPYFKVGGLVRFDLDEVDAWLESRRAGAT